MAELDNIREERAKVYGPSKPIFTATGKAFTAILEAHYEIELPHDIPAHVMAELMVVLKAVRAVRPYAPHRDNYDDQINYARLALEADDRNDT